ncbi:MAG: hypothetical protein HY909_20725 [Deltaproteobacteria bacterium]|nr:hypothetical protein [Deltaproteobacteria bacterium]
MDPALAPDPPTEVLRTVVWRSDVGLRARLHALGKWGYWLSVLVALGGLLPTLHWTFSVLAAVGVGASVAVMATGSLVAAYERRGAGSAALDARGLKIEAGGRVYDLPRERLAEGLLRWDRGGWQLRVLERGGARYDLDVPDRETGERWLRALGLDPARRAARVVSDRRVLQWAFAYFFGGFFAMPFNLVAVLLLALLGRSGEGPASMVLTVLTMVPGYYFAARAVGHADVTVGVDGVGVAGLFGRRFFPFTVLYAVSLGDRDRKELLLHVPDRIVRVTFASFADASAACERVRGALEAWRQATPPGLLGAWGSEPATVEQWRERFTAALRQGGYRAAQVTVGDVEAVVTAAGATPEQRVGAALALRDAGAPPGGAGLRVAVEASADPVAERVLERALRDEPRRARVG